MSYKRITVKLSKEHNKHLNNNNGLQYKDIQIFPTTLPYIIMILVLPKYLFIIYYIYFLFHNNIINHFIFINYFIGVNSYLKSNLIPIISSSDIPIIYQLSLLIWFIIMLTWGLVYQKYIVEAPFISYVPNMENVNIFEQFISKIRRFEPTPWGYSSHIQSAMFAFWPLNSFLGIGKYNIKYKREIVKFEDGGINALG